MLLASKETLGSKGTLFDHIIFYPNKAYHSVNDLRIRREKIIKPNSGRKLQVRKERRFVRRQNPPIQFQFLTKKCALSRQITLRRL